MMKIVRQLGAVTSVWELADLAGSTLVLKISPPPPPAALLYLLTSE